ncbi:hypothetical protein BS47DRAFT_1299408 [Hydnum rufescens UP504]|uniref:Copper transport protein n=1 Tax=Hydnum rufescens UP504 TaxID=1448309 RepID=A0A9P6ASU4_9AGAM|nr:hypothetical protein BS47DRAFT_1299408 [Hydnum rufescens UP504]
MNGMTITMLPYLHFTAGDAVWFAAWTPTSHGAISGTCIALVLLAIFDRLLIGVGGILAVYWAPSGHEECHQSDSREDALPSSDRKSRSQSPEAPGQSGGSSPVRRPNPFILKNDVPRGIVFFVQSTISTALMLAVMTWNAAYIISIILGLGVGEVLFGRFSTTSVSLHH